MPASFLRGCRAQVGAEAQEDIDGLFHGFLWRFPGVILQAISHAVGQNMHANPVYGRTGRGYLREDILAALILFHHSDYAAYLSFNPVQPAQYRFLGIIAGGHATSSSTAIIYYMLFVKHCGRYF
jgi:hypothetical protein